MAHMDKVLSYSSIAILVGLAEDHAAETKLFELHISDIGTALTFVFFC